MKYIKPYRIFESEEEFEDIDGIKSLFNLINNVEIFTIPYYFKPTWYGGREDTGFNIHVLYGSRAVTGDNDKKQMKNTNHYHQDFTTVQEIYHNDNILKKIYNLDVYKIVLTENKVAIIFKDHHVVGQRETRAYVIPYGNLKSLPDYVKDVLSEDNLGSHFHHKNAFSSGIRHSDGSTSNLSLFDWMYGN